MIPMTLEEIAASVGAAAPEAAAGTVVRGLSTDTRSLRPGDLFIALDGPRFRGRDHVPEAFARGAVAAVAADLDAAAGPLLRVTDGFEALAAIGRALRGRIAAPVVGITGSVGKTTTKDACAALLGGRFAVAAAAASFNNRVGVPLSLAQAGTDTEVVVLELGTSRPGEIAALSHIARPHVAIVTAVAESHLDGLGDIEGVLREKLSIRDGLAPNGRFWVCGDDPRLRAAARGVSARTFGLAPDCDLRGLEPESGPEGVALRLSSDGPRIAAPLLGAHNLRNLLAACAVALELGLSEEEIAERAACIRGPALRMERREVEGVHFLLDCYNANPESTAAALDTWLSRPALGPRVAVIGAMAELGAHSARAHEDLGRKLAGLPLDRILLVGDPTLATLAALEAVGRRADWFPDVESLLAADAEPFRPGDDVLLKGSRSVALERLARGREGSGS